jgi:hypothetical protein
MVGCKLDLLRELDLDFEYAPKSRVHKIKNWRTEKPSSLFGQNNLR